MSDLVELERRLDERVAALAGRRAGTAEPDALLAGLLDRARTVGLLEDMVRSRALDVLARELRAQGRGYYTIGSSGHELNALVGTLTRPTDPALLHYRSGAFMLARARRAREEGLADVDAVADVVHSLLATVDDPASGGRHKVWGSVPLHIPPQTSTIASHLPKAVGLAIALGRPARGAAVGQRPTRGRVGEAPLAPAPLGALAGSDAIVVCSFGDASFNHATAQAAFGAARWARRRGSAVPILFVCEDNGLGISVPTPEGWIAESLRGMSGMHYVAADGPFDVAAAEVARAVELARTGRAPVLLHLRTVRLGGHAGSDPELAYRDRAAVESDMARDPVALALERAVELGLTDAGTCQALVARARQEVRAAVSGDMDPGYGSTSRMIAESAVCLITDCEDLPGGIYTSAPAMGHKLIRRLVAHAGLSFRME